MDDDARSVPAFSFSQRQEMAKTGTEIRRLCDPDQDRITLKELFIWDLSMRCFHSCFSVTGTSDDKSLLMQESCWKPFMMRNSTMTAAEITQNT